MACVVERCFTELNILRCGGCDVVLSTSPHSACDLLHSSTDLVMPLVTRPPLLPLLPGGDPGGYRRGGQWSRSPPCSSGGRLLSSPRHPALGGSNPEVRRVQDTSTTALSKRLLERDGVHYYPGPEAPAQSSSVTFSDNGDTITSHRSPH